MLNHLNLIAKLALESSTPAIPGPSLSPGLKGQNLKWRVQVQSSGALVPAQVCNGLLDSFAALALTFHPPVPTLHPGSGRELDDLARNSETGAWLPALREAAWRTVVFC